MHMNNLKKRLKNGEAVHGCWLNLDTSISAEIMGQAGFDWILIDLEHGANRERQLISHFQALQNTKSIPLVRVENFRRPRAQRVLDMGAKGVMFPQITHIDDAKAAIESMLYPPKGNRGLAQMIPATQYQKNFVAYYQNIQHELIGIIQIEKTEILDHLDEVAAIEGVDVLFIGPSDLTLSMGIFGQFEHPAYLEVLKATCQAAKNAGKATGVLFMDPNQYDMYYQLGFRFLGCGSDMVFLRKGAEEIVQTLHQKKTQLGS